MARNSKKTRKIVVNEVEYRWRTSIDESRLWIKLFIWPTNQVGAAIECVLSAEVPWLRSLPNSHHFTLERIYITNKITKRIISLAISEHGYSPVRRAEFLSLGRVDRRIEMEDVVFFSCYGGYENHKRVWLMKRKMKACVLDGYTLNPGDLSWDFFEEFADIKVYDRSSPNEIVERAKNAQIVLSNKVVLNREIIEQLTELKYIGVLATGYNNIDIEAAKEKGIVLTNVPTYGNKSVAQFVMSHILNFVQSIAHHDQTVKDGKWEACPDFCYWETPLVELAGKTMGILGFGRIGQETAKLAQAFDMKVIVHNRSEIKDDHVEQVGLETLFQESDFLSLHCPLTDETENIIDDETISLMKPTAYLINTSRGPLVDEAALATALNEGKIAGASLDVLSKEPPTSDNPLLKAKNCTITPHIAWATKEARERLMGIAVENVAAFLRSEPQNVIT